MLGFRRDLLTAAAYGQISRPTPNLEGSGPAKVTGTEPRFLARALGAPQLLSTAGSSAKESAAAGDSGLRHVDIVKLEQAPGGAAPSDRDRPFGTVTPSVGGYSSPKAAPSAAEGRPRILAGSAVGLDFKIGWAATSESSTP